MTQSIDEKVQAKLRKLLALAERGVGGEKANAQRMLQKLLSRHGLTLDDLNEERRDLRWFPAPRKHDRKLALQIAGMVTNSTDVRSYSSKQRSRQVGVKLTATEAVSFELYFDVLRKALVEHLDIAYNAFIQVNRLFPKTDDRPDPIPTERDLQIIAMASAVNRTPVHLRLEQV